MKNMKGWIAALVLGAVASSAHAQFSYQTSYTFNLDTFPKEITNVMLLERQQNGNSLTWAFQLPAQQTSTITNPFLTNSVPTESLIIGITQDLPNDPPGQKHMVLGMHSYAAELSRNIAWGTLFRNTQEEDLIAALELATSGQDWPIILPGLQFIDIWSNSDAVNGILGPGGASQTAWFDMTAESPSFTVMAFSEGQEIGTGSASIEVVPEPATLGALGLGLLAMRRRRR